ncbi:hypothetical protein F4677DRAFT_424644 [Hypoxylon crocopeplum]|nr:hypothetical protein F4677DRAFT_424644 [Hypoxylon crocopeplum]
MNRKSRGPCKECISGGQEYLNGACQFSSSALTCSFYISTSIYRLLRVRSYVNTATDSSKKKTTRKRRAESGPDPNGKDNNKFKLTPEILSELSTRELE